MAFTITAIFVIFAIKQFHFRPAGPWNLGLALGLFAFTCRVMSLDMALGVTVVFNGMEYLTPVLFMIFIRVNFDDDFVLGVVEKSALVIMLVLAILFAMQNVLDTPNSLYHFQVALQFTIDALACFWAYWCVITTWSSDLDAKRRKARVFFVAGVGPVIAVMIGLYFYFYSTGQALSFLLHVDLLLSCTILVFGVIGLVYFLDIPPTLFGEFTETPAPLGEQQDTDQAKSECIKPSNQQSSDHQQQLHLLSKVMKEKECFKEMGLNLAGLAIHMDMPEYRLRALINEDLGYRNFNAYLNHYRIEHARHLLKDPNNTASILEISMECGYKALSTFNKVFKDITSLPPSEYRKKYQQVSPRTT